MHYQAVHQISFAEPIVKCSFCAHTCSSYEIQRFLERCTEFFLSLLEGFGKFIRNARGNRNMSITCLLFLGTHIVDGVACITQLNVSLSNCLRHLTFFLGNFVWINIHVIESFDKLNFFCKAFILNIAHIKYTHAAASLLDDRLIVKVSKKKLTVKVSVKKQIFP